MPPGMQRVALGLEYHGTEYAGFQKQSHNHNTIQAKLEAAISNVANETTTLICAGRTDAGVHASGQVLHFDTLANRPSKAWVQGVNSILPRNIRIAWAAPVPAQFHARFSALSRTYRYIFCVSPVRPATLHDGVSWHPRPLNFIAMQEASTYLVGRHNFSSFRSSQCQASQPVREIFYVRFFRSGAFWVMEVQANGFLHHMVRNIVGALNEIGSGRKPASWLLQHRRAKNRSLGPATADAAGLYLVSVAYPLVFGLPEVQLGPRFIENPQ